MFAVGALAATDGSPIKMLFLIPLLIVAAVAGDAANYGLGRFFGPRVFQWEESWLFNRKHLIEPSLLRQIRPQSDRLSRFLPIVRTFAPFVAGIGKMRYGKFWFYNVIGGIVWVTVFLFLGFWFGNLEVVKKNFELVIFGIVGLSILPMVVEWWRSRQHAAPSQSR